MSFQEAIQSYAEQPLQWADSFGYTEGIQKTS